MAQCPYTTAREDPMMKDGAGAYMKSTLFLPRDPRRESSDLAGKGRRDVVHEAILEQGDRIARPIGCAHARSWPTSCSGSATWVSPRVMCTTKRRPRPSKSSRRGSACPPQVSPTSPPVGGSGRGHHLRHAGLTFRGTGGIVGLDYTSRVAQEAGLDEFPISLPRIDGWHIRGGQVQPVRAGADNEASLNPTPAWRLCRPGAGGVELPRSKSQTEHHRTACRRTPPSGIGRHRQSGPSRADAAPATLRALVNDAPGVIVPSSAIEG